MSGSGPEAEVDEYALLGFDPSTAHLGGREHGHRALRPLVVTTKYKQYFGQLPKAHIDALMQLSPSFLPVVRAINTAPVISRSGVVIDGAGLDRLTGLVHRIDPLLRACLPERAPTEQDVREA